MNESGFAPAKNPHLNIQPDGGTGGTVMVPSLVDDTEYFYDSSAATRENLLPLENQSVDIIASHEAKTSKPIYDLPGAHQSHSKAGGECTSKDSRVNYFSKQQVNTNRSTTLKTTFSSYENIGGNGAKVSEILGLCNRTERSNMDDEDVAVNPSLGRSSTVGSRRDFGLLKIVKDSDRNIDSILSGINGGQDTQGGLYLTQSPLSQTTPGISAACIVKQPSSEPGFGAADACEPPDKPQKQSQSPLKTQNGTTTGATDIVDSTKAVKHVLMQANKLNTDPQIERSTLADGGFAVSDEPKMTENSMLLNLEDGEPEKTSATVKDEEIDSGGAKTLDCDLQMPSIAEAEFELDSSPWESSLGSSPNATSDDSSENDYEMLDPAEQARRLMQEDGGSEDGRGNKCTVNRPLRTLHEEPDEIVEKPNVAVTANMRIEPLGWVETLVENLVLVKAKTTGEHQVLETGSVLCLQDRTVIGVIAETLGRVQQPLYSIRFTNAAAIEQAGISKGTYIYYAPQYSTYVFTQTLKACKGSDASNIHDEEVGDDELEFSDDEIEAEHKRNLKLHRQGRRGERQSASNRSARAAWPNDPRKIGMEIQNSGDVSISYDEINIIDDLYTPLSRPVDLQQQIRQGDLLSSSQRGDRNRSNNRRRSRGDSNGSRGGRGEKSRGYGWEPYRTRGPDTSDDRQQTSLPQLDLSLPPIPTATRSALPLVPPQTSLSALGHSVGPPYSPPQQYPYHEFTTGTSFRHQRVSPYNGQASYSYIPQPTSPNYQPPYQHYLQTGQIRPPRSRQSMNSYGQPLPLYPNGPVSSSYSSPPLPPGAFVNPAFFGNHYQKLPNQQPLAYSHEIYPPHQNSYLGDQK